MFRFTAPVTMGNASASLAACVKAIDGGEAELGLDALVHSDSAAVAVLLAALRHAGIAGKALHLSGAPPSLQSLARLYGVDDLLAAGPPVTPAH